jgi:hypothetical protein
MQRKSQNIAIIGKRRDTTMMNVKLISWAPVGGPYLKT